MSVHDSDIRVLLSSLNDLVESEHDLTKNELLDNLTVVLDQLEDVDENITSHDSEIKSDLQTIMGILSNLGALNISELSERISDLASDLAEHDSAIYGDIVELKVSILDFQEETDENLESINSTLGDLAKLDEIITELKAIDESLDSAENEAKSARDVQSLNSFIITLFLASILITLLGGAAIFLRKNKMSKEGYDETSPDHSIKDDDDSSIDMIEY
jgi:hypothetical protein